MGRVVEALRTFEEKSASEWLMTQKIGNFDERCKVYISSVFPTADGSTRAWAVPIDVVQLKDGNTNHKLACDEMREELGHLIAHYGVVGGDKEVVKEAKILQRNLLAPLEYLEKVLTFSLSPDERQEAMTDAIVSFKDVYICVSNFQKSLYHQKHAFYFRKVKKWVSFLWNGMLKIIDLLRENKVAECLRYICNDLFSNLEVLMIGVSKASEKLKRPGANPCTGSVVDELRTFGKESLPKFLVDQMERDTTRYVNLTTIATFFSSVTATTLQFTYAETDSIASNSLRGVVNLFWFLSLVFSVSSAVSSLLGLTWRKSTIYDSRVPPRLIHMWFDKAPMLFLIIAAVAFVIGLNLFAYLSLQPRYVSFSTNILTGLHGVCLLTVTLWFIYQLKHDSIWAGWIRTVMRPITRIVEWIIKTGMTWIGITMKWLWKLVKWPCKKYKQNMMHLQRNIYWTFGIDNHVARINFDIDWMRDWPEPNLLSKLIRRILNAIKRCWSVKKKALSDLSRTVRVHICVSSPTGHPEDDVEMGEIVRREEAEAPEEILSENPAMTEFRKSLQTVFSDAARVDKIMGRIKGWKIMIMTNDPSAQQLINKGLLWGYPDLVKKIFEVVGPAFALESRRREDEEAQQQVITNEHVDNA